MQAVSQFSATTPRAREAKNLKFANDGSYKSVEGMLRGMVAKAMKRLCDMGLSIPEDDVMGMMNMGYVKAKQAWNPDRGVLFSTYCHRACWNNFNANIEKAENERKHLGMVPYDDIVRGVDGDEEGDALEILSSNCGEAEEAHEDRMIRQEEVRERLKGLSPNAGRLITALLMAEKQADANEPPKLHDLAAGLGLTGDSLRQVKLEIIAKFGVSWR